jgi:hypothetical protein
MAIAGDLNTRFGGQGSKFFDQIFDFAPARLAGDASLNVH